MLITHPNPGAHTRTCCRHPTTSVPSLPIHEHRRTRLRDCHTPTPTDQPTSLDLWPRRASETYEHVRRSQHPTPPSAYLQPNYTTTIPHFSANSLVAAAWSPPFLAIAATFHLGTNSFLGCPVGARLSFIVKGLGFRV